MLKVEMKRLMTGLLFKFQFSLLTENSQMVQDMFILGDRSSVGLELRIVVPDVAGSNPVDRPFSI